MMHTRNNCSFNTHNYYLIRSSVNYIIIIVSNTGRKIQYQIITWDLAQLFRNISFVYKPAGTPYKVVEKNIRSNALFGSCGLLLQTTIAPGYLELPLGKIN